jgi:hypothetical protein
MEPKQSSTVPPAVEDAVRDEMRQEGDTSALTPDPATARWPFPPSVDYLPEEPDESVTRSAPATPPHPPRS